MTRVRGAKAGLFCCLLACSNGKKGVDTGANVKQSGASGEVAQSPAPRAVIPSTDVRFAAVSAIPKCLKVTAGQIARMDNLVIGDLKLEVSRSIGECGCLSSSLLYRSVQKNADFEAEIARGVLGLPVAGVGVVDLKVMIAADADSSKGEVLTLHLGCRPPE